MAILSIVSDQGSLVGMGRFAKRHRQALNELLGTDFTSISISISISICHAGFLLYADTVKQISHCHFCNDEPSWADAICHSLLVFA